MHKLYGLFLWYVHASVPIRCYCMGNGNLFSSSKLFFLCIAKERYSKQRFGITWELVNYDRIHFWTSPVNPDSPIFTNTNTQNKPVFMERIPNVQYLYLSSNAGIPEEHLVLNYILHFLTVKWNTLPMLSDESISIFRTSLFVSLMQHHSRLYSYLEKILDCSNRFLHKFLWYKMRSFIGKKGQFWSIIVSN